MLIGACNPILCPTRVCRLQVLASVAVFFGLVFVNVFVLNRGSRRSPTPRGRGGAMAQRPAQSNRSFDNLVGIPGTAGAVDLSPRLAGEAAAPRAATEPVSGVFWGDLGIAGGIDGMLQPTRNQQTSQTSQTSQISAPTLPGIRANATTTTTTTTTVGSIESGNITGFSPASAQSRPSSGSPSPAPVQQP